MDAVPLGSVSDEHVDLGVAGMSAAGERGDLAHYGAAVLAGWWFVRDHEVGDDVAEAVARQRDLVIQQFGDLFEQRPHGRADTAVVDGLVEDLHSSIDDLWAIGHDVIFTTLAVRTLQVRPALATGRVADGLHRVIAWCRTRPIDGVADRIYDVDVSDATGDEIDLDPARHGAAEIAHHAFSTMLAFPRVYRGAHQGNIGHLMDHGQALVELARLGYSDVAAAGWKAFRRHVSVLRRIADLELDAEEVRAGPAADPRTREYWERGASDDNWASGHVFKYPYHMLDLFRAVPDPAVQRRILTLLGKLT